MRNSSFQAFTGALHYTPQLQAMLHVDAVYSDLMGMSSDGDAGYDPRMLYQAARLVEMFTQQSGTDITIVSPNNPYWHTGNPVPLAAGPASERRPDEYLWQVYEGVSAGKDASRKHAMAYLRNFMENSMFPK